MQKVFYKIDQYSQIVENYYNIRRIKTQSIDDLFIVCQLMMNI